MLSQDLCLNILKRMARPFDVLATAVASIMMAILVTLIVAQVVARYGFNSSIDVVIEVPRIAFILIIYLAMPLAYREGMHVGMNFLTILLPSIYARAITRVMCIVMIGVIVQIIMLAYGLSQQTWDQYLPSIQFPSGAFYAVIVFSSIHLLFHVLQSLVLGSFGQSTAMSE